jgi:DNA-directed RNA polymerase specialized sigma24 family protein
MASRPDHGRHVERVTVTSSDERTNTMTRTYGDPDALKEAIRALPHGQRHAIEMLKLQGLSLKEAAAASGMSIGALKIATHRAIGALRRALTKAR